MKPLPSLVSTEPLSLEPKRWWLRLHRALMPDYNRKATVYWWLMVLTGALTLAHTIGVLLALPLAVWAQVGSGVVIAMLAGFFPLRIPRSKNSFAAGEIFIFLLLLVQGPAAAAVAATGEALIASCRTSKRWTSRIVSPAMACIAMFFTGSLLQAGVAGARAHGLYNAGVLLMATVLCALAYFVVNTLFIAAVPYLKRSQWPARQEMLVNFGWIGINYVASASVACLLFVSFEQTGLWVLAAAAPIIAMLLITLHHHFRRREVDDEARKERLEAFEREAALSARHVGELQLSERRFQSAFTHASIGMALVSFDGRILRANAALCALLGAEDEDFLTRQLFSALVVAGDADLLNAKLMQMTTQQVTAFAIELRLCHRQGIEVWAALHGSLFAELNADAPCLILQVQDITARRTAEAGLHHIAFHDSLTGLPNRRRFQDELRHALQRSQTDARRRFGLMFLDFDRFKLINDSLGHGVGDEFLVRVAKRIQQSLRPTDVVARLGGDEFAVLAFDLDCEDYAVALAERLLEVLRQPLRLSGVDITTSASIGITFRGDGYSTPEAMLRDADTAMYKAKAAGKARYALFDVALHAEVSHRLRLESELRQALAAGALSVAYQPIFDLASARITSFEALARWEHPELGTISPATFIAVAEDCGLILPLTDFVLRSACRQLKQWQLRDTACTELGMHVNVSGNDIAQPGLVARVNAALVDAQLQAAHLTLELTENILMERLQFALPALIELNRLGVNLSVDDFGTGYSSLRHLSSLPVNSLKIDRAFVADLRKGNHEAAIVSAVIQLARSLGKSIVAEGIETAEQLEQLRQMGCTTGQGYYLARPMLPEQVDRLLDGMAAHLERVPGQVPGHAAAFIH